MTHVESCFQLILTLSLLIWSNSFHVIFSFHEIFVTLGHLVLSACTCVRAAQLHNVKDRRDHRVNRGFEKEMKNHRGNGIFPADMKWRMFPAKTKYYPRNRIFPAEIKYSPRKRNVAIFPAAEKIFPAAKDIPRGPEYIPRGNECNNIPRGRENIPRGKKYSPRPRKYSPRQKILPAAQKIFPAAKNITRGPENIPRGPENIPRGKKFSFLCPSQASVDSWTVWVLLNMCNPEFILSICVNARTYFTYLFTKTFLEK